MKRIVTILLIVFAISLALSSCKSNRPLCPAYGQAQTSKVLN